MRDPTKPARVLGYCRVSGREQGAKGTSLEGQRDEIERWCKARGYPKPRLFVEVESAGAEKIERRIELRALLDTAAPGDAIVVAAVDRWSRDIVFAVQSVRGLVARGVGWHALRESLDASTPAGDSTLGIMSWVADQERQRIRARTVGRRGELKDQGLFVEGPPPYGYRRGPREQRRQLELDQVAEEVALVREAYERCSSGSSVDTVGEWLEIETGRAWDKKTVHSLLRNRVYLGEVKNGAGEWIPGKHVPAITRELYERAQAAMKARSLGGRRHGAESRTASWLLRGLGICPDCGSKMGAAYSENRWARLAYYACGRRIRLGTCSAPYAQVEATDARADALALARLGELRLELARPAATPWPTARKPRDFDRERERIARARQKAITLATAETITAADLAEQLRRLDAELGKVELAAGAVARETAGHAPEARRAALAELQVLAAAWERAPVEVRREAIKRLAKRIVIRRDEVEIEWLPAEELAAELRIAAGGPHLSGPTDIKSRKRPGKRGGRR